MPSVDKHCEISKKRTGESYKKLHEWIDKPSIFFGENHRIERHTLNDTYLKYVKGEWGERGVIEWLFHIALDNLETANKFAIKEYKKCYDEILVSFDGKEISKLSFIRDNQFVDTKRERVDIDFKEKKEQKGDKK